MSLISTLTGTWTWNGTSTVTSDNTSDVVVDDWIRLDESSPSFKITAVNADVSVTLDLAGGSAPSGSGAQKDDRPVRDAIVEAGDVVITPETQAITESVGAAAGKTRKLKDSYSSATVYSGKTYEVHYNYLSGPDSKSWGALSGTSETVS